MNMLPLISCLLILITAVPMKHMKIDISIFIICL
uniref:NADH dehydrogenase subunit 5 n=1 Tax=Arundo donax TaxID=35708 RepID=A0A0A9G184_ARUDO